MIPSRKHLLATILPLLTFFSAHAQTIVTGKVVDEENRPLAGVFVSVREGTQGEIATTDSEGYFTLNVRDKANAIVDFSLLGFEKAETRISGNTVFVKMKESAMRLDDAVVVAYGRRGGRHQRDEQSACPVILSGSGREGRRRVGIGIRRSARLGNEDCDTGKQLHNSGQFPALYS